MPKKGHYVGPKLRGTHTTIISGSEELIKLLDKMPLVNGIAPGIMGAKSGRGSGGQLKVLPKIESGWLRLKVVKAGAVQIIRVYSGDLARVKKLVEEKFPA